MSTFQKTGPYSRAEYRRQKKANAIKVTSTRAFVYGISGNATECHLHEIFGTVGKVFGVRDLQPDPQCAAAMCCEVQFIDPLGVQRAMTQLNGGVIDGTTIRVVEAQPHMQLLKPDPEPVASNDPTTDQGMMMDDDEGRARWSDGEEDGLDSVGLKAPKQRPQKRTQRHPAARPEPEPKRVAQPEQFGSREMTREEIAEAKHEAWLAKQAETREAQKDDEEDTDGDEDGDAGEGEWEL